MASGRPQSPPAGPRLCHGDEQYQAYLADLANRGPRQHSRHGFTKYAPGTPGPRNPPAVERSSVPEEGRGLSWPGTPQDAHIYGRTERDWMLEAGKYRPAPGPFTKSFI